MSKYSYKKVNGKYIWTSPEMKLIFKDISFQAHDEYGYVKSIDDILYLYYIVEIYVKKEKYENGKCIHYWDLVTKRQTHDFPNLLGLHEILHCYLENNIPEEECRLIHFYNCNKIIKNRIAYKHSMDTDGFFSDDYYQVERMIIKENNKEIKRYYSLYVGGASDIQGGNTTIGVKTPVLESGLRSLYACITDFLNDAIKKNNEETRKKLLKKPYYVDSQNRLIKTENGKIKEMLIENTKLDMLEVYCGDLTSEDFYSQTYNHVTISKINKDEITIMGGYCNHRNQEYNELPIRQISLPISNLIFTFHACCDEILKMNEEEIAEDFKNLLTDKELNEIKSKTLKESYSNWYDVIVDRYIVYRDEHPFKQVKEEHRKNVEVAIRTILKILKKK